MQRKIKRIVARRRVIGSGSRRATLCAACATAASAAIASPLWASSYSWQGAASNDNWSNASAWFGYVPPPNDGSATVEFNSANVADAPGYSPNMDSNWTIDSLSFDGPNAFTLQSTGGYTLTLDGGLTATPTSAAETINSNLVLGGDQTWTTSNNGLTVNAVNLNSSALTVDAAGPTTFAGAISGSGSLTMTGGSTVTLSGANTYSGATTVNSGTLDLSNTNAVQNSTVNLNGGTLTFDSSVTANAFTLGGLTGSGNLALQNNAATPIALEVGSNNANTTYSGTISGGGTLTKVGTGTLTLSGPNTYTGDTTVSAGTLAITGGNVGNPQVESHLEVDGAPGTSATLGTGATLNYATAAIGDSNTGAFTQTGGAYNASVVLIGVSSSASGTFTQQGGTLNLGGYFIGPLGYIFIGGNGNGTFTQSGGATSVLSSIVVAEYSGSTGTCNLDGGTTTTPSVVGGSGTSTVNFNGGTLQAASDSTAFISGLTTANVQSGGAIIDTNGYNVAIAQPLLNDTAAGAAEGGLTKIGAGTLTLSGANTYSGATNVMAGTLAIAGGSVGTSSLSSNVTIDGANGTSVTLASGATLNSFSTVIGLGNTGTLTQAGGTFAVEYLLEIGSGAGSSGALTQEGGTLNTSNFYVGVNGNGTVTQSGGTSTPQSMTLADNSGSTGTYNLNGGTLTTGSVSGGSGTSTFNFNGGTLQANGDSTAFVAGLTSATVQAGGAILDTNGYNVTVAQSLLHDPTLGNTADGGLSKVDGGTLTLSVANTFTGPTTITGGTLNLADPNAVQYSTVSFGSADKLTFDSGVAGNAFTLGGLVGGGVLKLENNAATPAAIALSVGNNNASTSYSGELEGPGSLIKIGTGTLSLTSNDDYTGSTTVSAGTLDITSGNSSSTFNVNGGILKNTGTIQQTTNINAGGEAEGTGIYGVVQVNSGGIFHPGDSPGAVTTGNSFWGAGGTYQFDIDDATGVAGTNYSQWNIHGTLGITSGDTADTVFTIEVESLTATDSPGQVPDFNPDQDYSYEIATTNQGITGFNPADIAIDTVGFANTTDGSFSVSQVGNNVYLNYTAVPEPASLVMAMPLAAGLLMRRRRAAR